MDIQSQIQAAMEMQRGGRSKRETINTGNILFIVSGAFDRLREIIARRVQKTTIGFAADPMEASDDTELFTQVSTRDFMDFGFEPEFIGRLPVRVVCEPLEIEDLFQILKRSEGSVIRQYERAFRAYGMEVFFEDEALHLIAEQASEEKTGARGLLTVCERILRNFKYELPGSGVRRFAVDRLLIEEPVEALSKLLREGSQEKAQAQAAIAHEFAQRFSEKHRVQLEFDDEAVSKLVTRAELEKTYMRDLCERLFKDYEFGLKLVQEKMSGEVLRIPGSAIDDPDRFLSDWLVKHYRKDVEGAAPTETPD